MNNHQVRVSTKLSYGVGQLAEGVKNAAFGTFLLLYYNQVLGLSGSLAGTAIFIALCFDAVTDPIVGSISDNFKSKWGRRHPFLYASALPLVIAFYLLFAPPAGLGSYGLFIWMTGFTILTRAAMTLYHVPHLALGAELSSHYSERTSIVAYRQIFSVVGQLSVIALAYQVFFVDQGDVSGDLIASNYPPFALFLAVIMLVSILISAVGTHSQIPRLPSTNFESRPGLRATLAGVFTDFVQAMKNSSFKWLASATLCSFVMIGLQGALTLYMANFFWELQDNSKLLLLIATPAGFFFGMAFTVKLTERFEKKHVMIAGSITYLTLNGAPVLLRLLEWFPDNSSALLVPVLVACAVIAGIGGVQSVVTSGSMMADVSDEHELQSGRRQEGIFFGAISFSVKGASGFGTMLGGFALDIIAFPIGAAPGEVPASIIFKLGAIYGPMLALFAALAVWCLTHYQLSKAKQQQIALTLSLRRQNNKDPSDEQASSPLSNTKRQPQTN